MITEFDSPKQSLNSTPLDLKKPFKLILAAGIVLLVLKIYLF